MCSNFTDDDVGKRVETAAGESLGTVTMTEAETAYVDLESGVTDSITAVLDWDGDTDDIVPIDAAAVREIDGDAVRLEETETDASGGTDPVFERNETTVHEDEGSEQRGVGAPTGETGGDDEMPAEGEGRSGKGSEPETETMTESGAERHPDSEDQPPEGERTVTKARGENEDR